MPHDPIRLMLFDLDGTLADTAPDLAAAVNRMLLARGLEALPLASLRPLVSQGARGMIARGFGKAPGDAGFEELRQAFFTEYESALCDGSALFPGMDVVLQRLETAGVHWGIVTNKITRFTDPLVRALGLARRAACVVSGDTTPYAKPHPAPLLHALQACNCDAREAIYVGDDLRDVQAARAAGMRAVAAAYGYLGEGDPPQAWGADAIIDHPLGLLQWVRQLPAGDRPQAPHAR